MGCTSSKTPEDQSPHSAVSPLSAKSATSKRPVTEYALIEEPAQVPAAAPMMLIMVFMCSIVSCALLLLSDNHDFARRNASAVGNAHTASGVSVLADMKRKLRCEWRPEYQPETFLPPHELRGHSTVSERATLIRLNDIVLESVKHRRTKILCTLGPACATTDGISELLDAGLDIARLNFSHGDHDAHFATLKLFRCVQALASVSAVCQPCAMSDKWHLWCLDALGLLPLGQACS